MTSVALGLHLKEGLQASRILRVKLCPKVMYRNRQTSLNQLCPSGLKLWKCEEDQLSCEYWELALK